MDYGKIISTGWSQAWKHKTLWIFGFLISGGGGGNITNFSDKFDGTGIGEPSLYQVKQFFIEHLYIIVILAFLALIAFIIWIILATISTGGLVNAAGQLKRKEPYSFTKAFKAGVHYFWRIFGIGLLELVVIFALIILLGLIGVVAFLIHLALGILSLLFLIPAFIVCLFMIVLTVIMAERYIILEDRPVFDAINDGFTLWKSNLGSSLLYALIYIGIGIAVGLATLVIILFTVAPFVAVGFVNVLMAVLLGIPVVLLIMLVVEGFSGSAMHLMTTEFYFQLREKSSPVAAQPAGPGGDYSSPPPPQPAP